jgi:hypothetical protein
MYVGYIQKVSMNYDNYDEETLSVVCPDCRAAIGAKCLGPKSGGMGGMVWLSSPHRNRVLAAHGREQESIWGG